MSTRNANPAEPEVEVEINPTEPAPRCYNSQHLAMFAIAALVIGLLIGYGFAPDNKDEVTKLQGQVASLKSEADKVSGLEKSLGAVDGRIKTARAEGFDAGKAACPVPAPVAAAAPAVVAPVPACHVTAHSHAPARRAAPSAPAPVVRQHFDNSPPPVATPAPVLTTIFVGSGVGKCDWTNPKTGQNVVARANSREECLQTLTVEAKKQGFSSIIPANRS